MPYCSLLRKVIYYLSDSGRGHPISIRNRIETCVGTIRAGPLETGVREIAEQGTQGTAVTVLLVCADGFR